MTVQKKLSVVGQHAAAASVGTDRAPPYPADTRAKGWRFELDYEQIEQSDTWPLAAEIPMAQHALLMMWMIAWAQVPCGSYPDDEAVIRAKCRIPQSTWAKCREVLMRGWWRASDGRLYHDTLVKRVTEMMARRRSDADRQATRRAREAMESGQSPGVVTSVSRVTPPGLTPESSTDNRLPNTDTNTNPPKPPRKRRGAAAQLVSVDQLVEEGVAKQHAEDWLTIRKEKNLPLTLTAWEEVKAQALIAGLTLPDAVKTAAINSWAGFKAKWLTETPRTGNPRDVAGVTVPGPAGPDPALEKIKDDARRAAPMPDAVRKKAQELTGRGGLKSVGELLSVSHGTTGDGGDAS